MLISMTTPHQVPAMDSSCGGVENLESLVHWFESCNDAQQAAIGTALLGRANPKAAHLLHTFLQMRLQAASPIWRLEIQRANDPSFLNGLRNESRDVAVSQLLHYLPLLRPANPDAVRGYLHLLPRLLGTFLEDDHHNLNGGINAQQQSSELQQLLTYALIHPALSIEQKRSLAELIRQLDDNGSQEVALSLMDANSQGGLDLFQSDASADVAFHRGSHHAPFQSHSHNSGQWDPWNSRNSVLVPPPAPPPASSSSSCASGQRIRRSNSLTPPSNNMNNYLPDLWSTAEDGNSQRMKPRSQSLSSPIDNSNATSHSPLSPQNSLSSSSGSGSGSGSDSVPGADDNHRPSSFHVTGSGMRDVPSWLKSLRLHKYAHLFSLLSYEEMLSLTEDQLEAQGVTKGARHKIALSIQRLRERPTFLAQLEKEVVDSGTIHNALGELKNMLNTPIKPYHGPPGCAGDQDPVFHAGSLSPSPSLLMTRGDDTSGCSSLDGSTDSLVTSRIDGDVTKLNKAVSFMGSPPTPAAQSKIVSDMPTVIVSAAPDSDSGGEGSDTSGDDGINLNDLSYSQFSCYAFNGDMIGDVMGQSPVAQEDLPGQITRLLGKICTQLLVSASPSEENVSQFVALLERCYSHEAFTQQHRRRIASWKEQAHRIWNMLPVLGSGPATGTGNGNSNSGPGRNNKSSDSRFARRWSNVAHYPGFYNDSISQGSYSNQGNSYSLFPPRHQRHPHNQPRHLQGHHSTHNLYGQHTHLAAGQNAAVGSGLAGTGGGERLRPLAPTHSLPLNCSSLQVGPSHVALQHRNSFCVSALSSQSSLYSANPCGNYSPLNCGLDPFTFSSSRLTSVDDPPAESVQSFAGRMGLQRARSAPMAGMNGSRNHALGESYAYAEKDTSDIDLNHRLESLCLSMTEHALEGANDN